MSDPRTVAEAEGELRRRLGAGAARVVAGGAALEDYGRDESGLGTYPPELLVLAESAEEVRQVFEVAARHRLPVVPVGARSGKSGGSLAVAGGIALSLERMNRIL